MFIFPLCVINHHINEYRSPAIHFYNAVASYCCIFYIYYNFLITVNNLSLGKGGLLTWHTGHFPGGSTRPEGPFKH